MRAAIFEEPVRTERGERPERRRSRRSWRCVDVTICGAGRRWREQTCTLSLSGHGMLVALGTKVGIGELVLVRDPETFIEREGRVVGVGRDYGRRQEVAIEFTEPAPEFWLDYQPTGSYG